MNKLSGFIKNLIEKWKGISKKKKIAYSAIAIGIISSIIYAAISLTSTKYEVLFSNMDSTDSGAVYTKLKEEKVDAKVSGNSILVPKDQVDELRMQMLSEVPITNGSKGFEILDESKFGATDTEMKINYQRALQGELERTIKSFEEIENVRVHLVLPEDSAFVKDETPASASITLKIKKGKKLTKDQVKAMVALVSGSVRNLPKENVEINDTYGNLTKDLYEKEDSDMSESAEKQRKLEDSYEKDMEGKVLDMLGAAYGKNKVKVKVNADLNFDANQRESTTYDPKNVVVSEKTVKDTTKDSVKDDSGSPIDDQTSATFEKNADGSVTTHEDVTKNYEISKVQDKIIKAPGDVRRLTVSVILDGNLDEASKTAIKNSVMSAVGYSEQRGDSISVEGIPFDTSANDKVKKDLEEMEKESQDKQNMKMYIMIGIAAAVILGAIIAFIIYRRKKKSEMEDALEETKGIDVLIGDEEVQQEKPKFKPIDLDVDDEKSHVEKEIKKYANEKPEQVAEIVKSWLAEDER